ncbi:twin-arginine translocation signal domain-containing protein [Bradyrhizobium icense]
MKRRTFLKFTTAAVASALAAPLCARSIEKICWRYAARKRIRRPLR